MLVGCILLIMQGITWFLPASIYTISRWFNCNTFQGWMSTRTKSVLTWSKLDQVTLEFPFPPWNPYLNRFIERNPNLSLYIPAHSHRSLTAAGAQRTVQAWPAASVSSHRALPTRVLSPLVSPAAIEMLFHIHTA